MFTHSMTFDLGEDVNTLRDMVHRWAQVMEWVNIGEAPDLLNACSYNAETKRFRQAARSLLEPHVTCQSAEGAAARHFFERWRACLRRIDRQGRLARGQSNALGATCKAWNIE